MGFCKTRVCPVGKDKHGGSRLVTLGVYTPKAGVFIARHEAYAFIIVMIALYLVANQRAVLNNMFTSHSTTTLGNVLRQMYGATAPTVLLDTDPVPSPHLYNPHSAGIHVSVPGRLPQLPGAPHTETQSRPRQRQSSVELAELH